MRVALYLYPGRAYMIRNGDRTIQCRQVRTGTTTDPDWYGGLEVGPTAVPAS
jgi:hypothetical protein